MKLDGETLLPNFGILKQKKCRCWWLKLVINFFVVVIYSWMLIVILPLLVMAGVCHVTKLEAEKCGRTMQNLSVERLDRFGEDVNICSYSTEQFLVWSFLAWFGDSSDMSSQNWIYSKWTLRHWFHFDLWNDWSNYNISCDTTSIQWQCIKWWIINTISFNCKPVTLIQAEKGGRALDLRVYFFARLPN